MKRNYIKHYSSPKQIVEILRDERGLMFSWLSALVNVRNMCCHHARMWNREFVIKPMEPHMLYGRWIDATYVSKARIYYRACIIKYFLDRVSPQNDMCDKLINLFDKFPQIDLHAMGFPSNWQDEPLWQP